MAEARVLVPEDSQTGQLISAHNRLRQYDFLEDAFKVWKSGHMPECSHRFLYDLNFHAVNYVSELPGEYRSKVKKNVVVGGHIPPPWEEVDGHMERFFERMGRMMRDASPLEASAYALWRICWIHPFLQGNGRTARAFSYFVLCQKFDLWFSGKTIPERIRATRDEFCALLSDVDKTADGDGNAVLGPVIDYLGRLLGEQLSEANP